MLWERRINGMRDTQRSLRNRRAREIQFSSFGSFLGIFTGRNRLQQAWEESILSIHFSLLSERSGGGMAAFVTDTKNARLFFVDERHFKRQRVCTCNSNHANSLQELGICVENAIRLHAENLHQRIFLEIEGRDNQAL